MIWWYCTIRQYYYSIAIVIHNFQLGYLKVNCMLLISFIANLEKCFWTPDRNRNLQLSDLWSSDALTIELHISSSLIIHEENTKEINTETEFGYVMKHLHKIKPTFISISSLNTDLFEMLDQTLGRVFHQDIRTPQSC